MCIPPGKILGTPLPQKKTSSTLKLEFSSLLYALLDPDPDPQYCLLAQVLYYWYNKMGIHCSVQNSPQFSAFLYLKESKINANATRTQRNT
jgi:hypothetical protein